jgi:hypothetical protein
MIITASRIVSVAIGRRRRWRSGRRGWSSPWRRIIVVVLTCIRVRSTTRSPWGRVATVTVALAIVPALPRSRSTSRALVPGLDITRVVAVTIGRTVELDALFGAILSTDLLQEGIHFGISYSTNRTGTSQVASAITTVILTALTLSTIASNVARLAALATDQISGDVLLLGAVVFAMADLTTVLAGLILVITKSTVQSSKLSELIALEFILAFGNGSSRLNDVVNQLLGFVDLVFGVGHDQTMQILLLVAGVGGVGATFAFFDRSFTTDGNLGSRFGLHLLQGVAARANE